MSERKSQVILVTGASSGFGQACAAYLHDQGHRVYGTSRRAEPGVVSQATPTSLRMIQMDVDSDASVRQGVGLVLEDAGRLDVLLNNAGFGIAGAVEETPIEEAKAQFETNFFGALRICQAVLPTMRGQRSGLIINMSSIAGRLAVPFQGLYSAAKSALEGMSEALSMEVRPYGVRVALIEPGDFSTGFTAHRRNVQRSEDDSAYADAFARTLAVIEHDELGGGSPEQIARLVGRLVAAGPSRLRYPVAPLFQKLPLVLKVLLPSRLFEWILMKYYKLL